MFQNKCHKFAYIRMCLDIGKSGQIYDTFFAHALARMCWVEIDLDVSASTRVCWATEK
jgi:hypothetical protein